MRRQCPRQLADCCSNVDGAWCHHLLYSCGAFNLPASKEERKLYLVLLTKSNVNRSTGFYTIWELTKYVTAKPSASKLQIAIIWKMSESKSPERYFSNAGQCDGITNSRNSQQSTQQTPGRVESYTDPPSPADPIVTLVEVWKAVASHPNGSAGGSYGLFHLHLKDMVSGVVGETAKRLTEKLASIINHMLQGAVPANILPLLYGANLIELKRRSRIRSRQYSLPAANEDHQLPCDVAHR
ncbi:hypothetical protein BV898_14140 [Hypsibius exemplaris]|uniref:Uncharacterized protein n=1 Tax=Hypsibius exemplaris TaxID=2072580 RepID=A0A1W0W8M3_HYPEX|nr:hypothetical protein BV898_14140 [Hypsibius exemplaris]